MASAGPVGAAMGTVEPTGIAIGAVGSVGATMEDAMGAAASVELGYAEGGMAGVANWGAEAQDHRQEVRPVGRVEEKPAHQPLKHTEVGRPPPGLIDQSASRHVASQAAAAAAPDAPLTKAQLKNLKKKKSKQHSKIKAIQDELASSIVEWRVRVLSEPLQRMGFPPSSCLAAVRECTTGAKDVDIERCTTWLLGEQRESGKAAELDIKDELTKLSLCEARGANPDTLKDAVVAQNGDVDVACGMLA